MEARKPHPAGYPEEPETLGEHLKKVRLDRGLTRTEAAERIGVKEMSLRNWEFGWCDVGLMAIPKALEFLGYDPRPEGTTFGERLRRKREGQGLTQEKLGEIVGLSSFTISNWEADAVGKRYPRLIALLEEYLGEEG